MRKNLFIAAAVLFTFVGAGCNSEQTVSPAPAKPTAERPAVNSDQSLDLHGQGLTSVPQLVFRKTSLQELDLSHNELTGALPGEIRFLSKLRVLDASYNKMTGVPAEVGQLSELRTLNLSNNQLTGLPNELAKLKKLQVLDLSGNMNISEQDLAVITSALPNLRVIR